MNCCKYSRLYLTLRQIHDHGHFRVVFCVKQITLEYNKVWQYLLLSCFYYSKKKNRTRKVTTCTTNYFLYILCSSLPEQRAVGAGSSPAPGQGRGHREVVHAQRRRLPPGLLRLWQQARGTVAWSLLLVHLPGRQLKAKTYSSLLKPF